LVRRIVGGEHPPVDEVKADAAAEQVPFESHMSCERMPIAKKATLARPALMAVALLSSQTLQLLKRAAQLGLFLLPSPTSHFEPF